MEEWRSVVDYPYYEVSNEGNIRSYKNKNKISTIPHLLHPRKNRLGYLYVILNCSTSKGRKTLTLHRLVAKAFIPNPNNYPCINHKDENKANNRVDNLEWCTTKYNVNYGTSRVRCSIANKNHPSYSKPIYHYDFNGQFIKSYVSGAEAARQTGLKIAAISKAATHRNRYAGNWLWSYEEDYDFSREIHDIGRLQYWWNLQSIHQYDKEGNHKASFVGFNEVKNSLNESQFHMSNIIQAMNRDNGTCYGYHWEFGHPTYEEYLSQLTPNSNN